MACEPDTHRLDGFIAILKALKRIDLDAMKQFFGAFTQRSFSGTFRYPIPAGLPTFLPHA